MNYGFCDLCINTSGNIKSLEDILSKLYSVGYNTVAINQNIDESIFDNEKKKKKKTDEIDTPTPTSLIPEPINVQHLQGEFKNKLNILNRITFSFSDPLKTHSLNQLPLLKKYCLYGVIPKSQTALQYACSQLNVDIILIDSTCTGLKINRKLFLQAVERGIHFEIQYSNILDTNTRKFAIHYSHLYYTFGKSKNVVISSGANNAALIRNPYDVINLARLLGLSETKAKFSILQESHRTILKGEGRQCGKALFKIPCNEKDNLDDLYDVKPKKVKI